MSARKLRPDGLGHVGRENSAQSDSVTLAPRELSHVGFGLIGLEKNVSRRFFLQRDVNIKFEFQIIVGASLKVKESDPQFRVIYGDATLA